MCSRLLCRLFAPLLLTVTACGLAEGTEDEDNKFDYLTFSDSNFEVFCLETFDLNGDGRISRYEAQRVRSLDCSGREIQSLWDLAAFVYLERLDCRNNCLERLDLTVCPRLKTLNCSENQLTSINLDGLRRLTSLDCSSNLLVRLDVASNVSLAWLNCRNNALRGALDLSSCSVLLQADVRDNPNLATVHGRSTQQIVFNGQTQLL